MPSVRSSSYKFKQNILKASNSSEFEDAKKEWIFIYKESREEQDRLCICQHKIKYTVYLYNIKTKLTISVGKTCMTNFEMPKKKDKTSDQVLSKILRSNLQKGEYETIDDIIKYCNSIEEQVIEYFQNECDNIEQSLYSICQKIDKLNKLNKDIDNNKTKYGLEYLQKIYDTINNKITELEKQYMHELQRLQEEEERKRKEHLKVAAARAEQEAQEAKEKMITIEAWLKKAAMDLVVAEEERKRKEAEEERQKQWRAAEKKRKERRAAEKEAEEERRAAEKEAYECAAAVWAAVKRQEAKKKTSEVQTQTQLQRQQVLCLDQVDKYIASLDDVHRQDILIAKRQLGGACDTKTYIDFLTWKEKK